MPRSRGTRISSDHTPKGSVFGWCMDEVHERCIVSFASRLTDHLYTCSCTCHAESHRHPSTQKPNKNGANLAPLGVSDPASNL